MNIGIFDSGLGGLVTTMSLLQELPEYNYLYLGDTKRLPYGNRSQETILEYTLEAVEYLFKHDCQLIIVACNTASAEALRKIQQDYLPAHYPDRRVLGVLVPLAEQAVAKGGQKIGVLATQSTVESKAFAREIKKLRADAEIFQQAAPLLVPLIENDAIPWIEPVLLQYLTPLLSKKIDTLVLGCTHYALIKNKIRELAPGIKVVSQDDVLPTKLKSYLERHPEIEEKLEKNAKHRFMVTDLNEGYLRVANSFTKRHLAIEVVEI